MPSSWGRRHGRGRGYDKFRTPEAFTFADVHSMLWSQDPRPSDITRATVLGYWHQLKLEAWNEYQSQKRRKRNVKNRSAETW